MTTTKTRLEYSNNRCKPVAALAAYTVSRFRSTLGFPTIIDAFRHAETVTGIKADTIMSTVKQSFDPHFDHGKKGWPVGSSTHDRAWKDYRLGLMIDHFADFDEKQMEAIVKGLGLWCQAKPKPKPPIDGKAWIDRIVELASMAESMTPEALATFLKTGVK